MKSLQSTAGYTLMDCGRNEHIRVELNIFSLKERITAYRNKWKGHLE
jgi:hypothetical protein